MFSISWQSMSHRGKYVDELLVNCLSYQCTLCTVQGHAHADAMTKHHLMLSVMHQQAVKAASHLLPAYDLQSLGYTRWWDGCKRKESALKGSNS